MSLLIKRSSLARFKCKNHIISNALKKHWKKSPHLLLIIRLSICKFCKVTHCYTDELSRAKGREGEEKEGGERQRGIEWIKKENKPCRKKERTDERENEREGVR